MQKQTVSVLWLRRTWGMDFFPVLYPEPRYSKGCRISSMKRLHGRTAGPQPKKHLRHMASSFDWTITGLRTFFWDLGWHRNDRALPRLSGWNRALARSGTCSCTHETDRVPAFEGWICASKPSGAIFLLGNSSVLSWFEVEAHEGKCSFAAAIHFHRNFP